MKVKLRGKPRSTAGATLKGRRGVIGALLGVGAAALPRVAAATTVTNDTLYVTGLLGVGMSSGAVSQLHVRGAAQLASFFGTTRGQLSVNAPYTPGYFTAIDFLYTDQANPTARIGAYHDGSGSKLYLGTSNSYASGITIAPLIMDQSGNVGIGTGLPVARLDVRGTVRVLTPDTNQFLTADHPTWGNCGSFETTSGGDVHLKAFSPGFATPHLYLKNGGNVGIGTTAPLTRLHLGDGQIRIGSTPIADPGGCFYA